MLNIIIAESAFGNVRIFMTFCLVHYVEIDRSASVSASVSASANASAPQYVTPCISINIYIIIAAIIQFFGFTKKINEKGQT